MGQVCSSQFGTGHFQIELEQFHRKTNSVRSANLKWLQDRLDHERWIGTGRFWDRLVLGQMGFEPGLSKPVWDGLFSDCTRTVSPWTKFGQVGKS